MGIISISVYAVDTFTAINLLAFDRWAGQIKPEIPLNISRWIFAGCIILSFLLLIYRWIRAIRVMRQGGVAKSYLDPLAVRVQSIRWGHARGWKRFLVFAELTKSKKGADYVALFTYFSFEAWLRVVFAEGPRQVLNAITLYSVMRLKLIPEGEHAPKDGHTPVVQFFVNIGVLADENHLQAVILFGMLWTLFIWVISILSLIISIILYLLFLWHHIPTGDGGLTGYCRNKINRRMERIVKVKVDKALRKENELRARQEARAARQGLEVKKQPTLPNISTSEVDSLSGLSRQTTMTTLPEYSSRPGTGTNSSESIPTLSDITTGPMMPGRTVTHGSAASWSSYNSNAPLMASAGDMGQMPDRSYTPGADMSGPWSTKPLPNRSMTGFSQISQRSLGGAALPRPGTAQGETKGPGCYPLDTLPRPGTSMSNSPRPRYPPDNNGALPYPDDRNPTSSVKPPSWSGYNGDIAADNTGRRTPAAAVGTPFHGIPEARGRSSPLPGPQFRAQTPTRALPERSYTPHGPGPIRSMTPTGAPTLPRLQSPAPGGYMPYSAEPRSMTPVSSIPPGATLHSATEPTRTYTPYGRPGLSNTPTPYRHDRQPPQRQGSAVDDILDHY